MVMLKNYSLN